MWNTGTETGAGTMNDDMSRTERRKAATRANLLAAGEQQISTTGLSSVSIQTTTELADVALGTFYNHFANKDELIDEILERDQRLMRRSILQLQSEAADEIERAAAVVSSCVRRAALEPGWARFAAEFWAAGRWPTEDPADGLLLIELRQGIAAGRMTVEDELLAVVGGRDLVGGILRRHAQLGGVIDERKVLRHAVSGVLRLLGAGNLDVDRGVAWAERHPLSAAAFEEVG